MKHHLSLKNKSNNHKSSKICKKRVKKEKLKKKGFSLFVKKVKVEEILIFSKQFATMVKAGLPILEVLAMLRDQLEGDAIKEVIEDIRKSLEGGVTYQSVLKSILNISITFIAI